MAPLFSAAQDGNSSSPCSSSLTELPEIVLDNVMLNLHALTLAGFLPATCRSVAAACNHDELCQRAFLRDLAPEALSASLEDASCRIRHEARAGTQCFARTLPTLSEVEALDGRAAQELRGVAAELAGRRLEGIAATAATEGRPALLLWAMQRGASERADRAGRSILTLAAMHNHPRTVAAAIATGSELDEEYGLFGTALHHAAFAGAAEATVVLCEHGAGLEARNGTYRQAPLHVALSRNNVEVARVLLEANADPSSRDGDGLTAMALARLRCADAVELLAERGQVED